jgi:hypothetical protein
MMRIIKCRCLMPLSTIFQLYHGHPKCHQLFGVGNENNRRKSTTCSNSLTDFIFKSCTSTPWRLQEFNLET